MLALTLVEAEVNPNAITLIKIIKNLFIILIFVMFIAGCESSEPVDLKEAVCTAGDVFTYHYAGETVYKFFVNDEEQPKAMLKIVQGSVSQVKSASVYIEGAFPAGSCVYTDLEDE